MARGQLGGGSEDSTPYAVLDDPPPGRSGDRTDNDRKDSGPNGGDDHGPEERFPNVPVGVRQSCRPIDLLGRRPPLNGAEST